MRTVEESLLREGLNWVLWDKCAVEPTDKSWQVSSSRLSPVQLRGGSLPARLVVPPRSCTGDNRLELTCHDLSVGSTAHYITHFLAVGGGSSMDTAKAANLYNTYKQADLYDFSISVYF
jgi:hydroxyacid-oxoacid transhydrogenase